MQVEKSFFITFFSTNFAPRQKGSIASLRNHFHMENNTRHIQIWDDCLRIFQQNIEPARFDVWFKPIKPISIEGSMLTVEAPSEYFVEYLESGFIDIISKTLKRVIGSDAKLSYQVRPVQDEKPMVHPMGPQAAPVNRPISINSASLAQSNPGADKFPGLVRYNIDPRLNPTYCFANLITGDCNRMGITAGVNIANSPGRNSFNPLFLFGGSGLGKTHIAQAIGLEIKERQPNLVVLYVTGNEFQTQYVNATTKNNKLNDFMAFYSRVDVLIVDDIQELVGPGSQNAFFNIFNHLHQNGKQLIFTSDRPAVELQKFENRLLSRFKWGLSVELTRPDYATRLAMLKARARREAVVDIPDEVLEFVAARVNSNFRELEGTLISLMAHATLAHQDVTVELAQRLTDKIIGEEHVEITVDKIKATICDYFNISMADIESKSRKRSIAQARQIGMYYCRSLAGNCSLANIGAAFGGRDHATVVHACKIVNDLMSTDKTIKQYVMDIGKILKPADNL